MYLYLYLRYISKVSSPTLPKVECADFGGGARRPIVELEQGDWMPYGVALTRNYIFWSDWRRSGVHGAHRASGEMLEQPLPHILESAAGRPGGLVSVSPECPAAGGSAGSGACQNLENACAAHQGPREIVISQFTYKLANSKALCRRIYSCHFCTTPSH